MQQEPQISKITLNSSADQIIMTIGNDIVDYVDSARAFGTESLADADTLSKFQRRMISLSNRKGDINTAMILTIGNHNQLSLIGYDGPDQGWIQHTLSEAESFKKHGGEQPRVTAVDAYQSEEGIITICLAISEKRVPGSSRIFISGAIDTKTADWSALSWEDYGVRTDREVLIDGIRIIGKDEDRTIILSGSSKKETGVMYLLHTAFSNPSFDKAIIFNPAVRPESILKFEPGYTQLGGESLFVLASDSDKITLSYRPFPKFDPDRDGYTADIPPGKIVSCPKGTSVIDTGIVLEDEDGDPGTNIYCGGKGVYLIPFNEVSKGSRAKAITVATAAELPDVIDLLVNESEDGSATIWALTAGRDLYMLWKDDTAEEWNKLLLKKDIVEMAAAEGDKHLTASLILVNKDNESSFLMRDAVSGSWTETPLTLTDSGSSMKIACFSTAVRLLDGDGIAHINKNVTVSASAVANLIINGQSAFVGPDRPFSTVSDMNGTVTIYDKAQSFAPVFYRIAIEGAEEEIDINPASSIMEKLKNITDTELKKAVVQDSSGKTVSLLPKDLSGAGKEIKGVAAAFRQVASRTGISNTGIPGVWKVSGDAQFSSQMNSPVSASPQNDYLWAVQSTANGFQPVDTSSAGIVINGASDVFTAVGESLSDFFMNFSDTATEEWTLALQTVQQGLETVYEFICVAGDKIKRFVLETIQQVGYLFESLFEEIGIVFEKVASWVKATLGWDDILLVKDAFVTLFEQGMDAFGKKIGSFKAPVIEAIDQVISRVQDLKGEEYEKMNIGAEIDRMHQNDHLKEPAKESPMDAAMGNSIFATIFREFQNAMDEIISFEGDNPLEELMDALSDFVTMTATKEFEVLLLVFKGISKDLDVIVSKRLKKITDISLDTILEIIRVVGIDLITGVLEAARVLVGGIFDLVVRMIKAAKDIAFIRVRFPFIEKIIKYFTNENADVSFRIIDLVMLMVAMPATLIYKSIFDEAPVKKGQTVSIAQHGLSLQSTDLVSWKVMGELLGLTMPVIGVVSAVLDVKGALKELVSTTAIVPAKIGFLGNFRKRLGGIYVQIKPVLGFSMLLADIGYTLWKNNWTVPEYHLTYWSLGGLTVFFNWTYVINEEQSPGREVCKGMEGFLNSMKFVTRTVHFVSSDRKHTSKEKQIFYKAISSDISKALSSIAYLKLAKDPRAKLAFSGAGVLVSLGVFIPAVKLANMSLADN